MWNRKLKNKIAEQERTINILMARIDKTVNQAALDCAKVNHHRARKYRRAVCLDVLKVLCDAGEYTMDTKFIKEVKDQRKLFLKARKTK